MDQIIIIVYICSRVVQPPSECMLCIRATLSAWPVIVTRSGLTAWRSANLMSTPKVVHHLLNDLALDSDQSRVEGVVDVKLRLNNARLQLKQQILWLVYNIEAWSMSNSALTTLAWNWNDKFDSSITSKAWVDVNSAFENNETRLVDKCSTQPEQSDQIDGHS